MTCFTEGQIRQLETYALGALRALLATLPRCTGLMCNKLATHVHKGRQRCSDHGVRWPHEYPYAKAARDAEGLLWAADRARQLSIPPDQPRPERGETKGHT